MGNTVHATVRKLDAHEKVEHLHRMAEESSGRLSLFEADLLNEGSLDAAMAGCELIIHTASPFSLDPKLDPHEAFVRPAVEGTRNVLDSVNRTDVAKRVVLTSSIGAIAADLIDIQGYPRGVATEENWNTTSSAKHQPYAYSKTIAEKLAWDTAATQDRWDLVVINPAWIFGPSLSRRSDMVSADLMIGLADGRAALGTVPFHFAVVDVRDVADAHVKAGFQPDAKGRYLLFNELRWHKEIAALLDRHFGERYSFPRRELPKWFCWLTAPAIPTTRKIVSGNYGFEFKGENRRSIEHLGMSYRPAETTLVEHFRQIVGDGLV
jgi:nucleoside-diphosphate-sugar epimerase